MHFTKKIIKYNDYSLRSENFNNKTQFIKPTSCQYWRLYNLKPNLAKSTVCKKSTKTYNNYERKCYIIKIITRTHSSVKILFLFDFFHYSNSLSLSVCKTKQLELVVFCLYQVRFRLAVKYKKFYEFFFFFCCLSEKSRSTYEQKFLKRQFQLCYL